MGTVANSCGPSERIQLSLVAFPLKVIVNTLAQRNPYWWITSERLLGHFKSLIGNKAQQEGSIAEGYIVEEALTLFSRYFEDIESRVNRPKRVNNGPNLNEASEMSFIFPTQGKPIGGSETFTMTQLEKTQAHRYVLLNCAAVKPFISEFRDYIRRNSRGRRPSTIEVERRVNKEFPDWFPKRIMNPDLANTISTDLEFLAQGPYPDAGRFTAYNINEFKFRTLSREQGSQTQNSGVFLMSDTSCIASNTDRSARLIHTGDREEHDPYIEASQANMVYYVNDETDEGYAEAQALRELPELNSVSICITRCNTTFIN
ncbi:uncharacterized protein [Nicotiana sylvestris]|uniref:Uncharacterized protein LOC104244239 n=1 Tax=Nicotiana sylvestris TaxID=4096 RepID=A0A1U7YGJ0_NICSY|nr:PREDICTED: uncharacterized protein LOC104244239 [Nicotiana sylvestris]